MPSYPCIDVVETGKNIKNLCKRNGLTIKNLQDEFGFDSPQAIYKWIWGKCLPSIDNLVILARLLNTTIDKILIIKNVCY